MSQYGLGASKSEHDYRTITHEATMVAPVLIGGVDYSSTDIVNQHKVGICTAAAMITNANKATGKKFSMDFQYLLQKKFVDKNWIEGSSVFSSLKVGKNYGFLPEELFTYVTEADRELSYAEYMAKLVAIPDTEISRLLALCSNKLAGYALVDVSAPEYVQKAILDSKAGILCRFEVGKEWFTPSWRPEDIDPLQPPQVVISGHAVVENKFVDRAFDLVNSWGPLWNKEGIGTTHFDIYRATEAWIPYYENAPVMVVLPPAGTFRHNYTISMALSGSYVKEVEYLQIALMILGHLPLIKREDLGYYGAKTANAVLAFQIAKIPLSWYERYVLRGNKVGPKTLAALNIIFNKP